MHESYRIVSQNDVERQDRTREAFIAVSTDGPFPRIARIEVSFSEWMTWFSG